MRYERFGRTEPEAETVVLSAGLGGLGAYWRPQIEALAARFHVIAYDHRGTGANAGPLPDGYTIGHMADDVSEILDTAGLGRCHFVGHALGGLVGLDLALRAPARLASLTLVNAWATLDSQTLRCFVARMALLDHAGPEAYIRAQPIFLFPAPWLSRHAERLAREEAEAIRHFQGTETLTKRIGALRAFDVSARLGEVGVPTLVAASRDDILVPYTASEALAAGIPGARLAVTAEGGHGFTVTDPEPFNVTLIDFLTGLPHL